MGIHLALENYDDVIRTLPVNPIIVNEIPNTSKEERERLTNLITTTFSSDLLSNLPTCACGEVTGMYNLGVHCRMCGTEVSSPLDSDILPILWLRAPEGVPALINPVVWSMLSERFSLSSFNFIRHMCDTDYRPDVRKPRDFNMVIDALAAAGFRRGYRYFVENFRAIMDVLFNLRPFRKRRGKRDELRELLDMYQDCIFSAFLPLPNRSLLVLEQTENAIYIDPVIVGAVNAIRTIASIDNKLIPMKASVKANKTVRMIDMLSEFYAEMYSKTLGSKEGLCRKHIYGTRCDFSGRSVISSLTGDHNYRNLHIPWGMATSLLRFHVLNKLFKMGYNLVDAITFLNEHAQKYNETLDNIFKELIAESGRGIPVVFQRNPSLERASAQFLYVTVVKSDPSIATISMSILIVTGPNADFDGDQMNLTLALDNQTAQALGRLAPHMSVFSLDEPWKVSRNLSLPKTVVATIAYWMMTKKPVDPVKRRKMEELFGR